MNQLDGTLPSDIGLTLPNLQGLFVGGNQFRGLIPSSLQNASRLESMSLSFNQLTGQVPKDLGRLPNLRVLDLDSNQLGTASEEDINFIMSLTNCTNLEQLSVENNSFKGSIPDAIANLSTQITTLSLGTNQIYGSVPIGIQNLINLTTLSLAYNYLTGEIPKFIGTFPQMRNIYLLGNQFSGTIPDSFHNSTQLLYLDLSRNKLQGAIPSSLGACQNLFGLDLSDNNLTGTIPKQIASLSSITNFFNLSNNALSDSLPLEVGNSSNLMQLDVSGNRLSGHIPNTLGDCLNLVFLDMSGNFFQGNIPQSPSTLKGLQVLNLSHNNLSGEIPKYFRNFSFLIELDLSYNQLEGRIPNDRIFANTSAISIVGNNKLCGGVSRLKLRPCQKKMMKTKGKFIILKVILSVFFVSLALVLLLCFSVYMLHQRRMSRKKASSPSLFNHQYLRISYSDLLKATNSFCADNLVGVGSYGSVYKGLLAQTNTIVAVKVLNLKQRGASKAFFSECNALRNLQHRNLLKIITCCSSVDFQGNDFKALVFEFMPNGSLEEWLHPKTDDQHGLRNLNFLQRLDIAISIAFALDYLHHHCQTPIIHCDLKPTNVLLDDEMTARVADFGLAKVFSSTSSIYSQSGDSSLAIKGSIGYVAPEYAMGSGVSMQGDVYSYGILLLEMFTGKRPTDSMFQNGLTLHNFAKMALPGQMMNVVDLAMLLQDDHKALHCGNEGHMSSIMQNCLVSVNKDWNLMFG